MNATTKMSKLNIFICLIAVLIGYYSYVSLFRTEPLYKDLSWIHQGRSFTDYMYYGYYNLNYYYSHYCYKITSDFNILGYNQNTLCGTSVDYTSSSYIRYQYHNGKEKIKSLYSGLF